MIIVLLVCPYCHGDPKVTKPQGKIAAVRVECRSCGAFYEGPHVDGWNHTCSVQRSPPNALVTR